VQRRTAFEQSLRDRLFGDRAERGDQLVEKRRDVIVERRDIESPR
jgi:hypothetical protein